MQIKDYKKNWETVCAAYDRTREMTPGDTVREFLKDISLGDALETFSAVAAIKKHDGRIYGQNREFMNGIHHLAGAEAISHENPLFTGLLDHIHTTHINQLISELRKEYENGTGRS